MSDLNQNINALFGKLENFVTTKTVVGDAIVMGEVVILPLVDASFGIGAGIGGVSGDSGKKTDMNGGGAGARITPSAVLVVNNGNVQLVNIKNQDSVSKLIDLAPGLVNKISSLFNKEAEESAPPQSPDSK